MRVLGWVKFIGLEKLSNGAILRMSNILWLERIWVSKNILIGFVRAYILWMNLYYIMDDIDFIDRFRWANNLYLEFEDQ